MATADLQDEEQTKLLGPDDNGDGKEGDDDVKIGLVGESGSGKSSFVNAIIKYARMRLNSRQSNSTEIAETNVTSTTSESECYPHPEKPNIKLYELPFGTAKYPDIKTYFKELKLADKYDAFVLFTKANFTDGSQRLAKYLESEMKPFLLVRTWFDVNVDIEKKRNPNTFDEDKMKKEILGNIQKELKNLDSICGEQIFIISNFVPEKWDFFRLNEAILEQLPNRKDTTCMLKGLSIPFHLAKVFLVKNWENLIKADEETLRKITERAVGNIGIKGAQKLMKTELDKLKEVKISLAIIGQTGVGKSSFINTLRGIINYDELPQTLKVAPIGETNTTKTLEEYPWENNPNITLCDCPGVDTPKPHESDVEAYCLEIDIEKYDTFIILTSTRFTDYAGKLAKKLKSINKPFLFARTKIDVDCFSRKSTHPGTFNEAITLKNVKAECSKYLKGVIRDDNDIFLISNLCPFKWDFSDLILAIENRLPLYKRGCFLFSMKSWSEDILKRKVKTFKGRIKFVAFFFSMIPKLFTTEDYSRQNDFELIVEKVEFYSELFGFPKQDSEEFGMLSSTLQNKLRKFHFTTKMTVESWLQEFNAKSTEFPPWLDVKNAKEAPYAFVSRTLHCVLDEMKVIAQEILKEMAAKPLKSSK